MLATARPAFRKAYRSNLYRCRIIAGARYPIRYRSFHSSRIARQTPASIPAPNANNPEESTQYLGAGESKHDGKKLEAEDVAEDVSAVVASSGKARDASGIGGRRTVRPRTKEVPPVVLPPWFFERNIIFPGRPPANEFPEIEMGYSHTKAPDTKSPDEPPATILTESLATPSNVEKEGESIASRAEKIRLKHASFLKSLNFISSIQEKLMSKDVDVYRDDLLPSLVTDDVKNPAAATDVKDSIEERTHKALFKALDLVSTSIQDVSCDMDLHESDLEGKDTEAVLSKLEEDFAVFEKRLSALKTLFTEDPTTNAKNGLEDEDTEVNPRLRTELLVTLQANIALRPPQNLDLKDIPRPDTVLFCPIPEGTAFLNRTLQSLATDLNLGILRLDANDISEIVGDYLSENVAWTYGDVSLLGYRTQEVFDNMERFGNDGTSESLQKESELEDDDEDAVGIDGFSSSRPSGEDSKIGIMAGPLRILLGGKASASNSKSMSWKDFLDASASSGSSRESPPKSSQQDAWLQLKTTAVFESIIDTAMKEFSQSASEENNSNGRRPSPQAIKGLIVQIVDYKELESIPRGQTILKRLHDVVKRRWFEGANITIVGTSVADLPLATASKDALRLMQDEISGDCRTIFVPPSRTSETSKNYKKEDWYRTRSINLRHIDNMTKRLGGLTRKPVKSADEILYTSNTFLDTKVVGYGQIYRIAHAIVGANKGKKHYHFRDIEKAWNNITDSDKYKYEWIKDGRKKSSATLRGQSTKPDPLEAIRKVASARQKRLMGGIVRPEDIQTTFADVRCDARTVDTLKDLTSLSLSRPDAFQYGILATQRIPGILLYGPPGTGKTLLAKAVAKESGATVLEVSGSNLNEKYVGESEKNITALFQLAKQLSPCVIFIDEADSIFSARSGINDRKGHRESINQFLKELDGLTGFSGMLMVATNRPFDLDEAILRRLPRRILVDLPLEKDREAILRIHLAGESLDDSVDLRAIAKDTPLYSGSDLKNLSVAAALACVRAEINAAGKHTGSEPYQYPKKRILTKAHFDKAMEDISASISEDMSTLSAIRKFDERYGDRKGRRAKSKSLGFAGLSLNERDSDAGRVRKLDGLEV